MNSILRSSRKLLSCCLVGSPTLRCGRISEFRPASFEIFLNTLPARYIFDESKESSNSQGGRERTKGASSSSSKDMQRRTQALDLCAMFPDFPLEVCVVALENCRDNMEITTNWLFEHGFREMERMINDTIERSAIEADTDLLKQALTYGSRRGEEDSFCG